MDVEGPELREVLDEAARVKTGIDAFISSLAGGADGMGLPKEDGGTSTTVGLANRTGMVKGEAAKLRQQEQQALKSTTMGFQNRGDGTTRGSFTIPTADADILGAAIEGIINPRRANQNAIHLGMEPDDYKALSRPQKMGHAFIELIIPAAMRSCAGAHYLPTEALPKAGGLAATVAVTIDIDDLRTGRGYATTTTGTDISAQRAQRMACNAHLVALYLDGDNRVLDHGTTRRLYDRHQRLALAVRDKGCVWAGNGGPPHEAHSGGGGSAAGVVRSTPSGLLVRARTHRPQERRTGLAVPELVEGPLPPHAAPRRPLDRPHGSRRHRRSHRQQPRPG